MIQDLRRSPAASHRVLAAARPMGASGVTVSPSRAEVRRAEPSLSFQVVAPGATGFDVIVATEPSLFDPANAHRRTPKNFRSSRQDFLGEPVEIETGFYLLPRAFLRDLVSADPRPTRLHYVAVAYGAGGAPAYSVPPEEMARRAPHVALAADLAAANLSRVLGMAVERVGAVSATGRVMTARGAAVLPDAIGGLPVIRRQPAAAPRPAPDAGAGFVNRAETPAAAPPPVRSAPAPAPVPPQPAPAFAEPAPERAGGFVDEDYAYGGSALSASASARFRDLDRTAGPPAFDYDDGWGQARAFEDAAPPAPHAPPAPQAPIPPLDAGPGPAPAPMPAKPAPAPATGPAPDEDALLQAVIAEGAGGRYDALSLDGGFRGRFGPSDPYHQRAHDGLRLGPHQAMQDTGELGELLLLMRAADGAGFARIFGPEAEALLAVTTAEGPSALEASDGRGPRVQPVAGRDLWEEPWVERFRAAARHEPFQAAMRAQILARRLDPLEPAAAALGLSTPRGRAMLLAAAIHRGAAGAMAHLRAAVNPVDTPARLGAALDALGFSDLGAFRAASGLPPGDTVDDATHLALLAALRALGPDSPVQVPDAEAIMDALVTAAGPGTLGDALLRLRVSPAFGPAEG